MSLITRGLHQLPLLLALLLTIAAASLLARSEADMLGITSVLVAFVIVLWIGRKNPSLQLLLIIAFTLRASAGLAHIYLFSLPDTELDATTFERIGWEWAQQGWNYVTHNFTVGAYFYSWIISLVYLMTDRCPLLIQVINNLLAVGIVLNVFKTSRYLYGEYVALRVSWIAVLMPAMILYGTTTHREAFFTFFFSLGTYYLVRWYNDKSLFYFLFGAALVSFAAIFHYAAIFCLAAFFAAIYITFNYRIMQKGLNFVTIFSILFNSLIFMGMFYIVYNVQIGPYSVALILGGDGDAAKSIATETLSKAEGRLAYLQDFTVDSLSDIFLLAPLRILYFLFSPFIWALPSFSDILVSGEGILYFAIIILAVRSLIIHPSNKSPFPLLVMLATALFIFSFGSSNSGAAFRHKAKIAPLMIALIAVTPRPRKANQSAETQAIGRPA